jgi:hypothetical protein
MNKKRVESDPTKRIILLLSGNKKRVEKGEDDRMRK